MLAVNQSFLEDVTSRPNANAAPHQKTSCLIDQAGRSPSAPGGNSKPPASSGRTHQNVLVSCKGDPKRATEAIGPVELGEIDEADGTSDEAPQE